MSKKDGAIILGITAILCIVILAHQTEAFFYGGTNLQECIDLCVTRGEITLEEAYACPGICSGLISQNTPKLPPCNVQCATFCTKVHTESYCGCSCPSTPESNTQPSPPPTYYDEESYPLSGESEEDTIQIEYEEDEEYQEELEKIRRRYNEELEQVEAENEAYFDMVDRVRRHEATKEEVDCRTHRDGRVREKYNEIVASKKWYENATRYALSRDNEFYFMIRRGEDIKCYKYSAMSPEEVEKKRQKELEEENARKEELEKIEKDAEAVTEINKLIEKNEAYAEEVPCGNIHDPRITSLNQWVKEKHANNGENVGKAALDANNDLYSVQIINDQQSCYKYVKIPYSNKGGVKYRSVVPIPDLTQEQIDFVNSETIENERRIKNPTLLEQLSDDLQRTTILHEEEFEWAPGLNVQVSSNPKDITVWGAKVIAGPAIKALKGKIIKKVLPKDAIEKISNALEIVSKSQAIYEIADATPKETQLTGDYKLPFGITIGITYAPELIPEGYSEENLGFFHSTIEGGKLVLNKVESYKIDKVNRIVYGKTSCCSEFFVGILKEENVSKAEEETVEEQETTSLELALGFTVIAVILFIIFMIIFIPTYLILRKKNSKKKKK